MIPYEVEKVLFINAGDDAVIFKLKQEETASLCC